MLREPLIYPSTPESRQKIEDIILGELEKITTEETIFAVRLALEEAVVNAIRHGNKLNPEKKITVEYEIGEYKGKRGIKIVVRDEGPGFDLDSVPNPTAEENLNAEHGRGILLMNVYMDEVIYNERGNQVTLIKYF